LFLFFRIDDSHRPVPIKKIVVTYQCPASVSDFCFDLKLNYKLADIVEKYSNDKPTLIVNLVFFLFSSVFLVSVPIFGAMGSFLNKKIFFNLSFVQHENQHNKQHQY
jgi:hypothetical protein